MQAKNKYTVAFDARGKGWKLWGHQSPELDIQWLKLRAKLVDTGAGYLAVRSDFKREDEEIFKWTFPDLNTGYSAQHGFYFDPAGVSIKDFYACASFVWRA